MGAAKHTNAAWANVYTKQCTGFERYAEAPLTEAPVYAVGDDSSAGGYEATPLTRATPGHGTASDYEATPLTRAPVDVGDTAGDGYETPLDRENVAGVGYETPLDRENEVPHVYETPVDRETNSVYADAPLTQADYSAPRDDQVTAWLVRTCRPAGLA